MFNLKGKTAVVTGSGSGIGKAVALLFAKQGAQVCVLDLNEEACKATVTEIENSGGAAFMHVCNVATQEEVKEVFEKMGNVDILVNSAGVSHIGNVENTTEADLLLAVRCKCKGSL